MQSAGDEISWNWAGGIMNVFHWYRNIPAPAKQLPGGPLIQPVTEQMVHQYFFIFLLLFHSLT